MSTGRRARPYQSEAAEAFFDYVSQPHDKFPIIHLPTGTGKTWLTAALIIKRYVEQGQSVMWITHRDKLARDAHATIQEECGDVVGYVGAGLGYDYDEQVIVVKKDTVRLGAHLSRLSGRHFGLVVVDEVHHYPSRTYRELAGQLEYEAMLGLTATPERTDKLRLADYAEIVYSYSQLQAIEEGYILRPHAAVSKVPGLDLSKVKVRKDYVSHELEAELLRCHIVEHTVQAIVGQHTFIPLPFGGESRRHSLLEGGGILVYCAGIDQAEQTKTALHNEGVRAMVLHSKMPQARQNRVLDAFEAGEVGVIVNCGILTEGTDLPIAQSVVLARATTSWPLYIQMVGRACRLYPGQERSYVLDLVGATKVHSIVSTSVLLDGQDCRESTDGRHRILPGPLGGGYCTHCGLTVPCFDHRGGHEFKRGTCSCGALQCPESPDSERGHHFVPWEAGLRMCIWCGLEHPDPTTALIDRINPPPVDVLWKELAPKGSGIYASHLGDTGILYNIRVRDRWWPMWYALGKGRAIPLSKGPVSAEMSRHLTNDVARKAKLVRGQAGRRSRKAHQTMAWREARYIASKLNLGRFQQ